MTLNKITFSPKDCITNLVNILTTLGFTVTRKYQSNHKLTINGVRFHVKYMTNGVRLVDGNLRSPEEIRFIYGQKNAKWVEKQTARLNEIISWELARYERLENAGRMNAWSKRVLQPVVEAFNKEHGSRGVELTKTYSTCTGYSGYFPFKDFIFGPKYIVDYSTHQSKTGLTLSLEIDKKSVNLEDMGEYLTRMVKYKSLLTQLEADLNAAIAAAEKAGNPAPVFS